MDCACVEMDVEEGDEERAGTCILTCKSRRLRGGLDRSDSVLLGGNMQYAGLANIW